MVLRAFLSRLEHDNLDLVSYIISFTVISRETSTIPTTWSTWGHEQVILIDGNNMKMSGIT